MKRGVWVEPADPIAGFYCEACTRPEAYRWHVAINTGRSPVYGVAYLCTRHLHQLARSAMRARAWGWVRLAKRGKR